MPPRAQGVADERLSGAGFDRFDGVVAVLLVVTAVAVLVAAVAPDAVGGAPASGLWPRMYGVTPLDAIAFAIGLLILVVAGVITYRHAVAHAPRLVVSCVVAVLGAATIPIWLALFGAM